MSSLKLVINNKKSKKMAKTILSKKLAKTILSKKLMLFFLDVLLLYINANLRKDSDWQNYYT
jgi:hypothetical protein